LSPKHIPRLIVASTTAYADFALHLETWPEYPPRSALSVPTPEWPTPADGGDLDDLAATVRWALEAAPAASLETHPS
jgi:hypothetical protein